jgi:hypothetical protein
MHMKNRPAFATTTMLLGGSLLVAPAASADSSGVLMDSRTWTRSCGTTYKAYKAANYAATVKAGGGSCKGDAWVRVRWAGGWSAWKHHSREAEIRLTDVSMSQHKGCSNCTIYTLPI